MKYAWIYVLLLAILFVANILWGSVNIPLGDVWAALTGGEVKESWRFIILEGRLPQAVTAMLCGAGLSAAGLILQTVFRNPLAGPSILGIDTGANLGVAIVVLSIGTTITASGLTLSGFSLIIIAAMCGALGVMALLMVFAHLLRTPVMLLITGIMISFITSPIITLLNFWATDEGVHSFLVWGMGNFAGVSLERLPLFAMTMCTGIALSIAMSKPLNLMLLGDLYATNLGLNVHRTRNILLCTAGWLTAVSTAFCGPISFVGLAVPHLARLTISSNNHRHLLPATLSIGSMLTLLCNLLSTLPADRGMIPINVMTPLIGAPIILYVILRSKEI